MSVTQQQGMPAAPTAGMISRVQAPQPTAPAPRGQFLGLYGGQIVTGQVALALLVGGYAAGTTWLVAAVPIALILLILAFGRLRRRWTHQWIGQGVRYFSRRRSLPPGSDAMALLDLLRPAAATDTVDFDGTPGGIIEDAYGMTAVLEVGDTTGLLADTQPPVPPLIAMLPPAGGDQPPVRLQLLTFGVAAPALRAGTGPAATSYRQLTEGRILAQQRVLLAVHISREGGFADADLRRSLGSAVRRVRRRLDRDGLTCRPLAADILRRVLADLAHHDPARAVRESWGTVELGGLRQTCFRLRRWPDPRGEIAATLLPRLLTLPGGGTTVSLAAERAEGDTVRAELVIRLAAPSAAALATSIAALQRLVGAASAKVQRLDGAQLEGLAATLPLGGDSSGPTAALAGLVAGHDGLAVAGQPVIRIDADVVGAIESPVGGSGLMLGVNRHGEPVTVRLFRPEPTRAALIGGLRCAQMLALRAIALGAHVIVQSGRPYAWEPFLRSVGGSSESVTLVAPGRIVEPPPATPTVPQLLVVDVGPVGATGVPVVESAWRATLLVRDDLTAADLDIVARADLALLQPLTPGEATLAAAALGLGDSAGWLTRIRADMLGVVVGRRTLRWALLSTTPLEQQIIGPPTR